MNSKKFGTSSTVPPVVLGSQPLNHCKPLLRRLGAPEGGIRCRLVQPLALDDLGHVAHEDEGTTWVRQARLLTRDPRRSHPRNQEAVRNEGDVGSNPIASTPEIVS